MELHLKLKVIKYTQLCKCQERVARELILEAVLLPITPSRKTGDPLNTSPAVSNAAVTTSCPTKTAIMASVTYHLKGLVNLY